MMRYKLLILCLYSYYYRTKGDSGVCFATITLLLIKVLPTNEIRLSRKEKGAQKPRGANYSRLASFLVPWSRPISLCLSLSVCLWVIQNALSYLRAFRHFLLPWSLFRKHCSAWSFICICWAACWHHFWTLRRQLTHFINIGQYECRPRIDWKVNTSAAINLCCAYDQGALFQMGSVAFYYYSLLSYCSLFLVLDWNRTFRATYRTPIIWI
jgi:small-conductance mechanosensitive channel